MLLRSFRHLFLLILLGSVFGCASDSGEYQFQLSAYQIGDKPVHVIYRPKTADYYSRISRGYAESGITELTLTLDSSGKVIKAELEKSSGYSRLDTSAMALSYSMVFEPSSKTDPAARSLKLFANFHKESITPPVKVTNVTSRVELLTGFQHRAVIGAIANPEGFMESVYPLKLTSHEAINEDVLGYGSRYQLEPYPESQRESDQTLRLQITFN